MNRGTLQSSPVPQMMAGNPNWWININNISRPSISQHQQVPPPDFFPQFSPTVPPLSSNSSWNDDNQELSESWGQLLRGGLVGEEDKIGLSTMQAKKLENWEDQQLLNNASNGSIIDIKQENSASSYIYGHGNVALHHQTEDANKSSCSHMIPVSPPKSCVTSLSSNMLEFSNMKSSDARHPPQDHSSECNSTAIGGVPHKKARVQPFSAQSTCKVRKEKLGNRITTLHQIVSPFGKTDTASVLLEAIGYIRFLQNQIEALSLPYLGSGSGNMRQHQQQYAEGERNCLFPEDPGLLLNDNCRKKKLTSEQDCQEEEKDLRSRGLCLVPVSCTLQVGSDNGADYWAPAIGGGF